MPPKYGRKETEMHTENLIQEINKLMIDIANSFYFAGMENRPEPSLDCLSVLSEKPGCAEIAARIKSGMLSAYNAGKARAAR